MNDDVFQKSIDVGLFSCYDNPHLQKWFGGGSALQISVTSRYHYRQLLKFCYFHAMNRRKLWIIPAVCDVILFGMLIFFYLHPGEDSVIRVCRLVILVCAVVLPICCFAAPGIAVKRSGQLGTVCRFDFAPDEIRFTLESGGEKEESFIKYMAIYGVYETNTDFYLYISKHQAYILDKNGFQSGTAEELRELLRTAAGSARLRLR